MQESKISEEISEIIKGRSNAMVRVIVSLDKDTPMEDAKRDLAEMGLEIENAVPGPIPFVSGSISINRVPDVAAIPAVKKVERDSEVHAL